MATYEEQIRARDLARMQRVGMTPEQQQAELSRLEQTRATTEAARQAALREQGLVPKVTQPYMPQAAPETVPQLPVRPEPMTRAEPTVATPERAVITRPGTVPTGAVDREKALEDIAVKRAMGQPLTEQDLRTEFQAAREINKPVELPVDEYMPPEFAGLTAQQIMNLSPADQYRYSQYADQAKLLRQRDFQQQMSGQIEDIFGEKITTAEQERTTAEEQIRAQNEELLQEFKNLREQMDVGAIEQVREAGTEAQESIKAQMARRGFGRSSATAEQLRKASDNTQRRVQEIELATGAAVSQFQVQLLDRLDQKMTKYEAKVEKYQDAKDQVKLAQVQQEMELAQKIFEADPKNPDKILELAGVLQQIQIQEEEALKASAVNKFEKALEYGYIPTFSSPQEAAALANNLGVSTEDLPLIIGQSIERANWKQQVEQIHYETDSQGNVTAVMPNYDTGTFDRIDMGQIGKGVENRFQITSNPVTGATMIFDPSTGQIVAQQSPFGGWTGASSGGGMPGNYGSYGAVDDNSLNSIFGVGQAGDWCGVFASKISDAGKVGDSWAEKQQKITHFSSPTPGDKLLIPIGVKSDKGNLAGEYGHLAVVLDFDPSTGNIKVVESNADGRQNRGEGPGIVTLGTYNINELNTTYGQGKWGFMQGNLKPEYQKQLDAVKPTVETTVGQLYPERYGSKTFMDFLQEEMATGTPYKQAAEIAQAKLDRQAEAPEKLFEASRKLAAEYKPLQSEIRTLEDGFAVAKNFDIYTDNPYSDQALIFAFMKVLDPGSVVRENEFQTAMNNASYLQSFSANWEKAVNGTGMLLPEQRTNILEEMENLYKTKKEEKTQELIAAVNVGKTFGLEPEWYLTIMPEELEKPTTTDTQQQTPGILGSLGTTFSRLLGGSTITVRQKATGLIGTIPAGEYDPNLYEKV